MMEKMRESAQGTVAKVIMGLLLAALVLTGVGLHLMQSMNSDAATVNGDPVSRAELDNQVEQQKQRMISQYGDAAYQFLESPEQLARMQTQVLDDLINRKLYEQIMIELSIATSDAAIKKLLMEMPELQEDGKFSLEKFKSALARIRMSEADFKRRQTQQSNMSQLVGALSDSAFVLDNEIQKQYQLNEQLRDVSYLTFNKSEQLPHVVLQEGAEQQYYDDNKDSFVTAEQISIEYLELDITELEKSIEVTDELLQTHYQENIDNYTKPARRKPAHILVEVDSEASEEEKQQAQQKLQAALARINAGEDFAAVVSDVSDDVGSNESGGELDFFEVGEQESAFDEALFNLEKQGDISPIIQTEAGFHILKLLAIEPVQVDSFEQVRQRVEDQYRLEKAELLFTQKAETIVNTIFSVQNSLQQAATESGLEVKTSELFSRNTAKDIFANPKILDAAFSADVLAGRNHQKAIEISATRSIFLRKKEHVPSEVKPFADVKDEITAMLKDKAAKEQTLELATALVAKLNAGEDVAELLGDKKWQENKKLKRTSGGLNAQVRQKFFTMPRATDRPSIAHEVDAQGNVYVMKLNGVSEPEKSMLDTERRFTEQTVKRYIGNEVVSAMEALLREQASISLAD